MKGKSPKSSSSATVSRRRRRRSSNKSPKSNKSSKSAKSPKSNKSSSSSASASLSGDTIFDLLEARNDEFSTFIELSKIAKLDGFLGATSSLQNDLTAFVPNNAAFDAAMGLIGKYLDIDIWGDRFVNTIVAHHLTSEFGVQLSTDWEDGQTVKNADSSSVQVFEGDPNFFLNGNTINEPIDIYDPDNVASNGVFHALEGGILTPLFLFVNLNQGIQGQADFSNFFDLLSTAGLNTLLSGEGPVQVWGVPNLVFDAYQAQLDQIDNTLDFIQLLKDDPNFRSIMDNHIVEGSIFCGCKPGDVTLEARSGFELDITNVNGGKYAINGGQASGGADVIQNFLLSNGQAVVINNFLFADGQPGFLQT